MKGFVDDIEKLTVGNGDFRRAAYLHGYLLRDYWAAANVLMSGGHFRDAALLYRDKVKDRVRQR